MLWHYDITHEDFQSVSGQPDYSWIDHKNSQRTKTFLLLRECIE